MNTARIGLITIGVAVGASVYLSLRGAAPDDVKPAQETRAPVERVALSDQGVSRDTARASAAQTRGEVKEPVFEPGDPELLPPSQTFDQVLEAVNADVGPDGQYVDRETLATVLSSDAELSRLLNESEF
jgi:hypothetical protein